MPERTARSRARLSCNPASSNIVPSVSESVFPTACKDERASEHKRQRVGVWPLAEPSRASVCASPWPLAVQTYFSGALPLLELEQKPLLAQPIVQLNRAQLRRVPKQGVVLESSLHALELERELVPLPRREVELPQVRLQEEDQRIDNRETQRPG